MAALVTSLHIAASLLIAFFGLHQAWLAWQARKFKPAPAPPVPAEWPLVAVQLPLYNEPKVVIALMRCIANLNYPGDIEIQLLDDSDDTTSALIASELNLFPLKYKNFKHLQRTNRKGFKAGALAWGMKRTQANIFCLFDADFRPKSDFLLKTVPHLMQYKCAAVQARWGHLNADQNLFTRLLGMALDAHFVVEHTARKAGGSYMNFNGTAGLWQRAAIDAAGGWHSDTLTEDLDLSLRVQLEGWHISYLPGVKVPAELPATKQGVLVQQNRWNRGGAQCASKLLGTLWRSNSTPLQKAEASVQLLSSSVYLCVVIALITMPMAWWQFAVAWPVTGKVIAAISGVGSLGFFTYYAYSNFVERRLNIFCFILHYLLLMLFSVVLALHTFVAVAKGLTGKKSSFIRTPKTGVPHRVVTELSVNN